MWRHEAGSTLAQENGLVPDGTKPLIEPLLIYHRLLWHSPEINSTGSAHELNSWHVPGDYTFGVTTTSTRGQWVNFVSTDLELHGDDKNDEIHYDDTHGDQ